MISASLNISQAGFNSSFAVANTAVELILQKAAVSSILFSNDTGNMRPEQKFNLGKRLHKCTAQTLVSIIDCANLVELNTGIEGIITVMRRYLKVSKIA